MGSPGSGFNFLRRYTRAAGHSSRKEAGVGAVAHNKTAAAQRLW